MKFKNLVCFLSTCEVGDYVRLSRTGQIVQLVAKESLFYQCQIIGTGYCYIEPSRRVHREVKP